MRLLNIYSLELEEYLETNVPPYFILSHRWEEKEITLKDFVKGRHLVSRGRQKIEEFCAFATIQSEEIGLRGAFASSVVQHVWIDTCMARSPVS